jgi:DNA-binding MarR family transcriptional regulator
MATAVQQDHVDRFLETLRGELPDLDLTVEGIVERISGLSKRLHRMLDETLAEYGISSGEWKVLAYLRRQGDPFCSSPGELSELADLSSGAMTNRLDRLERAGLVRRLPDPDDRRGVKVELTKEGHDVYERSVASQAQKEGLVASTLNDREKEQLNALLRRLMLAAEKVHAGR